MKRISHDHKTETTTIATTIPTRHNGPPGIGNGGIVCGLLAEHFGGDCEGSNAAAAGGSSTETELSFEVELKRPAPIGRPLQLAETGSGEIRLHDGEATIAIARPRPLAIEVPAAPSWREAEHAHREGLSAEHPFPDCFVCGPGRPGGDGLRVICGPVAGRPGLVATAWRPHAHFADATGEHVDARFVWAALDCPGGLAALAGRGDPILLARFRGHLHARPRVGERCLLMGWAIEHDGRKHRAGTALIGDDGRLLGAAESLWIEPRRERSAA